MSARKISYRDGAYYSSSKSIVTNRKPEQNGKVRYSFLGVRIDPEDVDCKNNSVLCMHGVCIM